MGDYEDKKRNRLRNLKLTRVDRVAAGANPESHIVLFKSEADLIAKADTSGTMSDQGATLSDKTDETLDVQPNEVDISMADDVTEIETVAKADFEAVQKQLEDLSKALEDAQAEKAEAAEQVAKMEADRKAAEFVAKAKDYANIGKADELGALLLAANESFSAEQYQALERLLKAANAQMEAGDLFAQFSKAEGDEPTDVVDKVNALAKAKVDAGEAKTLQIAKLEVLRENRELAAEYSHATRVS